MFGCNSEKKKQESFAPFYEANTIVIDIIALVCFNVAGIFPILYCIAMCCAVSLHFKSDVGASLACLYHEYNNLIRKKKTGERRKWDPNLVNNVYLCNVNAVERKCSTRLLHNTPVQMRAYFTSQRINISHNLLTNTAPAKCECNAIQFLVLKNKDTERNGSGRLCGWAHLNTRVWNAFPFVISNLRLVVSTIRSIFLPFIARFLWIAEYIWLTFQCCTFDSFKSDYYYWRKMKLQNDWAHKILWDIKWNWFRFMVDRTLSCVAWGGAVNEYENICIACRWSFLSSFICIVNISAFA